MLEELKKQVCEANLELVRKKIVIYTWGNVSGVSREKNVMIIKPSGISYEKMSPDDMVCVDLKTGEKVEGKWNPSSDTKTHLELYRKYPEIGGVAHTHSVNAVAFAQAGSPIRALGTTHADYFYGDIPCTRMLTKEETEGDYENNTGKVILQTLEEAKIDPVSIPGILVHSHGPFTWGKNAEEAVFHAVVLETIAEMALKTILVNPGASLEQYVLDKHYSRKHGAHAYYGQVKDKEE